MSGEKNEAGTTPPLDLSAGTTRLHGRSPPPVTLPDAFYDVLGLAGAALFIVAFAGMQVDKLDGREPPALLMNFAGAILILISLAHDFNLGSFVLETIWGLIALYGLVRWFLRRRS
jgi:hypothetical protein